MNNVINTTTQGEIYEGRFFDKSDSSKSKFLLRYYSNGQVEYIAPSEYVTTAAVLTTHTAPASETKEYTTVLFPTTAIYDDFTTSEVNKTTTGLSYDDYFPYLTNSSVQVTSVDAKEENSYWYNDDYSLASRPIDATTMTILATYKGYTNPIFAGHSVDFSLEILGSWYDCWVLKEVQKSDNTIGADGSFEYTVTFVVSAPYGYSTPITEYKGELQYYVDFVKLTRK